MQVELIQKFRNYLRETGLSQNSIYSYRSEVGLFLEFCYKQRKDPFDNSVISTYLDYVQKGFSSNTYLKKKAVLSKFRSFCKQSGITIKNKMDTDKSIPYNEVELGKIRLASQLVGRKFVCIRNSLIIELALKGLSLNEILKIPLTSYQPEGRVLRLQGAVVELKEKKELEDCLIAWMEIRGNIPTQYKTLIVTSSKNAKPVRKHVILKSFISISHRININISFDRLNVTCMLKE